MAMAWALALVLLAAQALALWHRTVHGTAVVPAPVAATLPGHGHGPGERALLAVADPPPHAAADTAFGHSSDEAGSCRLYDQAGFGEALTSAMPSLTAALPDVPGGDFQPASAQARTGWRPPARAPPARA